MVDGATGWGLRKAQGLSERGAVFHPIHVSMIIQESVGDKKGAGHLWISDWMVYGLGWTWMDLV